MDKRAVDIKMIQLIHENPCIWQTDSPKYNCYKSRVQAWNYIAKKCGFTDERKARSHWKKLRDGHRQAVTRARKNNDITYKKWKYEDAMHYLLPYGTRQLSLSKQYHQVSSDSIDEDVHIEYLDETSDDQNDSKQNMESIRAESSASIVTSIDDNIAYITNNKRNISNLNNSNEEKLLRFEVVDPLEKEQAPVNNADIPTNSALGKFFSSMYETTSSLPERLQVRVQRHVFNAVMEAHEEYLATQESKEVSNNNSF